MNFGRRTIWPIIEMIILYICSSIGPFMYVHVYRMHHIHKRDSLSLDANVGASHQMLFQNPKFHVSSFYLSFFFFKKKKDGVTPRVAPKKQWSKNLKPKVNLTIYLPSFIPKYLTKNIKRCVLPSVCLSPFVLTTFFVIST